MTMCLLCTVCHNFFIGRPVDIITGISFFLFFFTLQVYTLLLTILQECYTKTVTDL